jgi:hypothetical protein
MTDELPPASPEELERLDALIVDWLERQLLDNPLVQAVERDVESGERRWLVRVEGEEKPVFTVWFHLRQRTLHVETYVLPAPLENHAAVYEYVLRRNLRLNGVAFAIGLEDAVYLVGQLPVAWITEAELDRLLGTVYAATEQSFRPAMRLAFGDRFTG